MIRLIKSFIPMSLLFKIKYIRNFTNQQSLKVRNSKKIFFLDSPDYGNIGDQAIALAIKEFAGKNFPDYEFVEILQKDVSKHIKSLKKQISKNDIIFLTGGGNMGNVYKIYEATRRFVIQSFPSNKIIVFPQTIDYTDDLFGKISLKHSKKIYNTHKALTLCAREKESYKKMKAFYPNANIILCPDIVLYLTVDMNLEKSEKVALCLRDDCERVLTESDAKKLINILNKENVIVENITTSTTFQEITSKNRENIVINKIRERSKYRFVVTDRLHAMIFCIVSHTPCIVFNNSNGKVKGVYELLGNSSYVKYVNNIEEVYSAVCECNNIINNKKNKLTTTYKYDELIKEIRKV